MSDMKKLGKVVSYILLVLGVANMVFLLTRIKKAIGLASSYELISTFGEKSVDMSKQPEIISLGAMFSDTTLDYTQAKTRREPYVLELMASYARVKVLVPEEWYVETNGKLKLSGIENMTMTYEKRVPDLIIDHDLVFAGLEIKVI